MIIFGVIKKKGVWIKSNKKYARAKLLLKIEWVQTHVPSFSNNGVKYEIKPAPEILYLNDDEKMKDGENNVVDIETRGERNVLKCYFKVKDVAKCFEMKRLNSAILNNGGYEINKHYKYFMCKSVTIYAKIEVKKTLFLTYRGLTRCLYVSRNKHANRFQDWANKILFTAQMGTREEKINLANNILGVPAYIAKDVLKTSATAISSIYLFSLNKVSKLRNVFDIDEKIPDDAIVCKYGFTKDLNRRTSEHLKTLGKIKEVELKLKFHCNIDPSYLSNAETDIKYFFDSFNMNMKHDKYKELVIISESLFKIVKKQFENLSHSYSGGVKDLIMNNENIKKQMIMKDLKHENELLKEKNKQDSLNKDLNIMQKDLDLMRKDLEVAHMKNELLQYKLDNALQNR